MATSEKQPIDALTGLRFIAALAVFIHHVCGKFGILQNSYSIGSLAVTFFFVLSGFVLTYAYHDRLNTFSDVRQFCFKRFSRIWPLHVVCLILAYTTYPSLGQFSADDVILKLSTHLLLLQSWVPDNEWVFAFNGVAWSISAEAFFYVLFPLLMFGNGKWLRSTWIALLAIVFLSAAGVHFAERYGNVSGVDFFRIGHLNPLMRLPDFLIGILAGNVFLARQVSTNRPYQFWVDTIQELACIFLIVAISVWVGDSKFQQKIMFAPWGSQFLGSWFRVEYPVLLFGITVYVFGKSQGFLAQLLRNRLMVYLGDVSYSFYMIHFLVLRKIYVGHESYGLLTSWQLAGLSLLISLGLAIILYELIEMPMKSWLTGIVRSRTVKRMTWRSRLRVIIALLMTILPLYTLAQHVVNYKQPAEVKKIVAGSKPGLRNQTFGSHITLLGAQVQRKTKKLEIRLAWFKKINSDLRRFVIVINKKGKHIGKGQHNQAKIENSSPGESFSDIAYVSLEAITPGSEIVVMFRSKTTNGIKVSGGERRLNDRSIVLFKYKDLAGLPAN